MNPDTHQKYIIIGPAHPYRGGIAAFSERLARELIAEGNQVELVTFTLQYPSFLFPGTTQYSSDPAPEGLIISRRMSSVNPLSWISAGRYIRRQRPHAVVFAYWMSFMAPCFGTIAAIARLGKRTRCIAIVHNMVPHEPNILDRLFPGYFVCHMDGFLALSDKVCTDIARFDHKGKPRLFRPHPIYDHYGQLLPKDEARRLLNLPTESRYLLFFGFIRAYKGLDLLLDAMADPRVAVLDVHLLVAGEWYDNSAPYLQQIERNGLQQRVHLHTQFISNAQVNQYFSAADLITQTYHTATQSGVTQIAYHFCKPMLVTNVGGLSEIVPHGKTGYVVEPQAQSIADAIVDFYTAHREPEFIAGTQQEKLKYLWSNVTEALHQLSQ